MDSEEETGSKPSSFRKKWFCKGVAVLILQVLCVPCDSYDAKGAIVSKYTRETVYDFLCWDWVILGDYTGRFQLLGGIVNAKINETCLVPPPPAKGPEEGTEWVLIADDENKCGFWTMYGEAQNAGYSGLIFYRGDADRLEIVQVPKHLNVTLNYGDTVGCMVDKETGVLLQSKYTYQNYTVDLRSEEVEMTWWFIIVLAMIFGVCVMLFVLCFRFAWYLGIVSYQRLLSFREDLQRIAQERRRAKRNRLFAAALKQIPSQKWDPTQLSDACAICVEDFVLDEDLRILTCNHGFHLDCIDEWLVNGRRDCPVCKRKVVLENREEFCNTDSETDDETAPLLSVSSSTPGSSTSSQPPRRTNPFLRGTVLNIQQSAEDEEAIPSDSVSDVSYSRLP